MFPSGIKPIAMIFFYFFFAKQCFVCRFNGFLLWLTDIYKWIYDSRKPLFSWFGAFVVVVFDNPKDKKIIWDSGP